MFNCILTCLIFVLLDVKILNTDVWTLKLVFNYISVKVDKYKYVTFNTTHIVKQLFMTIVNILTIMKCKNEK